MPRRRRCDLCNTSLPPYGFYIVRIDVFAEPSIPPLSAEDLEEIDLDNTMRKLLKQMKEMSADELQDQVHRRFEYKICVTCKKKFLTNPLGKPRGSRTSRN